ncbi:hypothetical protein BDR22DRAFT_864167 [Usnea florida]
MLREMRSSSTRIILVLSFMMITKDTPFFCRSFLVRPSELPTNSRRAMSAASLMTATSILSFLACNQRGHPRKRSSPISSFVFPEIIPYIGTMFIVRTA